MQMDAPVIAAISLIAAAPRLHAQFASITRRSFVCILVPRAATELIFCCIFLRRSERESDCRSSLKPDNYQSYDHFYMYARRAHTARGIRRKVWRATEAASLSLGAAVRQQKIKTQSSQNKFPFRQTERERGPKNLAS
jgi:hypothetical protein